MRPPPIAVGFRQLAIEPLLLGDARLGEAGEQAEDDRRQEQRRDRGEAEAADDDPAERAAGLGAGAAGQEQRQAAEHGGDHGHDHRAQADERGVADRLVHRLAGVAELVGELDDQDAVLRHQADQHDQADLAVDVERAAGEQMAKTAAARPKGTVAIRMRALMKLSNCAGQHQNDDEQREGEGLDDAAGGVVQLLGLAGEDQSDVGGQVRRRALQIVHRLAQVDALGEVGADGHGAALILARQARRHRDLLEGDQRGQRHHLAVLGAELHVVEGVGVLDHAVGHAARISMASSPM